MSRSVDGFHVEALFTVGLSDMQDSKNLESQDYLADSPNLPRPLDTICRFMIESCPPT